MVASKWGKRKKGHAARKRKRYFGLANWAKERPLVGLLLVRFSCGPLALKLGWRWASLEARIGPSSRAKLGLGKGPIEAIKENKIVILLDKKRQK